MLLSSAESHGYRSEAEFGLLIEPTVADGFLLLLQLSDFGFGFALLCFCCARASVPALARAHLFLYSLLFSVRLSRE